MDTFKPQPLKERKSQNLTFWDFTKDKLFWAVLPIVTGGGALLFGIATKFKVPILDGSPDLLTHAYAKAAELITRKGGVKEGSAIHGRLKDIHSGRMMENVIEEMFGLPSGEKLRKFYYNFAKGAEVALPFSAYVLWNKTKANRLQLTEVDEKLRELHDLKPSNAELAEQNKVMRAELAYAENPDRWRKRVSAAKIAEPVPQAISPRGAYTEEARKEESAPVAVSR